MASSSVPTGPAAVEAVQTSGAPRAEAESTVPAAAAGSDPAVLACLQLSAAEVESGLIGLESDLAYVLEEAGVDKQWRGYIGSLGLTRLNAFAMLAPSEQQMADVLKQDFGLDPRTGIKNRVQHAVLLDAWDRCKKRVSAQSALAAESSAAGQQLHLPKGTQLSMRRRYEAAFGEISDNSYPSKDYLLDLLEQIEEGENVAEELTSIISWESSKGQQEDVLLTIGTVKVRGNRRRSFGAKPKSPEELRKLYRIMWAAWTVVRLKHPEQRMLQGIGRDVFEELLDYVLGERCWERSTVGRNISWDSLLVYETQIRREAAKFVNRGKGTLAEGIRASMKDANLRTEYYVEAVAMSGVKRTRSPQGDGKRRELSDSSPPPKRKHKSGKGKGRGKGAKGRKTDTPDDRGDKARSLLKIAKEKERLKYTAMVGGKQVPICLRFNRCETCIDCKFVHMCIRCGGSHQLIDCKAPPVAK